MCCAGCAEVLVFDVFGVGGCGGVVGSGSGQASMMCGSVAAGVNGHVVRVGVGGQ